MVAADANPQLDKSPKTLQTDELAEASRFIEYLKELPSFVEAERELQEKTERELRAMVLVWLSGFKQLQMTAKDRSDPGSDPDGWDRFAKWSRYEKLDK